MITVDEVCFFVRQIARATGLPLLVDGDTGYGEALNVMHMVRSFEDAGAGAVHIEDQLLPKKCGHLNDKKLADPHDMAAKIAAARRARRHLYIIARTDAAASEGIDGCRRPRQTVHGRGRRCNLPRGADHRGNVQGSCPPSARRATAGQHDRVRPHAVLHRRRVRSDGLQDGDLAGQQPARREQGQAKLYAAIQSDGGTQNMVDHMQTRAELYATIGYHDYEALDASIVTTIVPQAMPQRS